MHKRHLVDMRGEVRKQLGQIAAGLAVLFEGERAADADVRKRQPALQLAGHVGQPRQRLAVQPLQLGLVFERVDLADAALHEQEDAVLGLPRMMLGLGRLRVRVGAGLIGQQSGQRESSDPVAGTAEKVAPGAERRLGGDVH